MHADAGDRLGVGGILLRDHLVILHGHRRVVQALEYAAHLREYRHVVRKVLEASLARVQRGQRLIEPDVDPDQPQNRLDALVIVQRRFELLLRVPHQPQRVVALSQLNLPPPVLVLADLRRLNGQVQRL